MKRTEDLVNEAKALRNKGYSYGDIAERISKRGKTITKDCVYKWLRAGDVAVTASPDTSAPPPTPVDAPTPPITAPPSPPTTDERVDMGPDELRNLLAGELRKHQAEAAKATVEGRGGDARQSSRLVAVFTNQLQRIHARQDEDTETVRVKASDIAAASERALSGLSQLAARVAAERATWPKCSSCNASIGSFAEGDKSPLRLMFERVTGG